MFTYKEKSRFGHSWFVNIFLMVLMWLPITLMLFFVAYKTNEISIYLFSFSLSIIFALMLFKNIQENIEFPMVAVSNEYIVINSAIGKRRIYNLEKIQAARFFKHLLYFRHNGWPVFVSLPKMDSQTKTKLLKSLKDKSLY